MPHCLCPSNTVLIRSEAALVSSPAEALELFAGELEQTYFNDCYSHSVGDAGCYTCGSAIAEGGGVVVVDSADSSDSSAFLRAVTRAFRSRGMGAAGCP